MSNGIFIYPTDTVWGVGGNIHEKDMAQKVNLIKGHTDAKPLSILFNDLNILADYFQLELLDMDWLGKLFSMETTLGLPITWIKKEIPVEAYGESSFICVRVLKLSHINELLELAGGPVYTTSLNDKDKEPIINLENAKKMRDRSCPEAHILGGDLKLSGHSSTILTIDKDLKLKILRPGNRAEEIEKHLKLLTT